MTEDWQQKVDKVWAESEQLGDQVVMDAMDALRAYADELLES